MGGRGLRNGQTDFDVGFTFIHTCIRRYRPSIRQEIVYGEKIVKDILVDAVIEYRVNVVYSSNRSGCGTIANYNKNANDKYRYSFL